MLPLAPSSLPVAPSPRRVQADGSKTFDATLHVAPEKFWERALVLPPYPSVSTYDAKVWQFVLEHGNDGDYVWNVGKDVDASQVDLAQDLKQHGGKRSSDGSDRTPAEVVAAPKAIKLSDDR